MSLTHLRHLQESQLALVLDQGASLHVSPGLLGDLHEELLAAGEALTQDVQVHRGPHIVHVGDEAELLPLGQERIQEATIRECLVSIDRLLRSPLKVYCNGHLVEITMTWRIPVIFVSVIHNSSS